MEKKVTAGSPISQNEENVKAFFRKNFDFGNSPLISQSDEKVKTFIEENSEVRIAQNSENVKRYSEFFSKCLIPQNLADVKTFFVIIFDYLTMKREVAILRDELDSKYYRMYVYPRTLRGLSTAEFVKVNRIFKKAYTDLEAIDDFVEEVEAALAEAHLLKFVNTLFENISLDGEITVEVIDGVFFR